MNYFEGTFYMRCIAIIYLIVLGYVISGFKGLALVFIGFFMMYDIIKLKKAKLREAKQG